MNTDDFVRSFFSNNYFSDEQTLRLILENVGKTAAVAALSAFLGDVVLKSMVTSAPTRFTVESGVPVELYAVGRNDYPTDVYVSSRRTHADWRPALFFASVFLVCKLVLEYREKNVPNVTRAKTERVRS
ncbi:MAG: hypothetical protein J6F31_06750 [Oscillospiraceae bacterium]|nr:hypothetical protein [Oscillospiraceae bacterium]